MTPILLVVQAYTLLPQLRKGAHIPEHGRTLLAKSLVQAGKFIEGKENSSAGIVADIARLPGSDLQQRSPSTERPHITVNYTLASHVTIH